MAVKFKTIGTRKGRYVLEWSPNALKNWLNKEDIAAEDFAIFSITGLKILIRELYALACKDCIINCPLKQQQSQLSDFARALEKFKTNFFADWSEVMSQTQHKDMQNKQQNICLDRLQAGLFYLTTQYTVRPCPHIAERIVWQLEQLCHHPHIELLPQQKHLYSRSLNLWRGRMPSVGIDKFEGNQTHH